MKSKIYLLTLITPNNLISVGNYAECIHKICMYAFSDFISCVEYPRATRQFNFSVKIMATYAICNVQIVLYSLEDLTLTKKYIYCRAGGRSENLWGNQEI